MKCRNFFAAVSLALCPALQTEAQTELLKYGDFDQWVVRNIKESGIIGGQTKQL